jgi:signal transduction histidine kinase
MAEFAEDLSRAFTERWPAIKLIMDVSGELVWTMDRDQMSQAVWALLHNAAEAACREDEPLVGLTMARDGEKLAIVITDSGPGMPPESAALIFRPFHTTKPEGTGIGLSLAMQIARAHGGTLDLTGADPTVFRLSLPA